MNDIIKSVKTNKQLVLIIVAAMMFVFFALCSAIDIAGKAQANGLKVLFQGRGLGFSRFLSFIIMIVPVLVIVSNFINLNLKGKLKENFNTICFAAGFVSCLLMAIVLPKNITLSWGGWLYFILAAGGTAISHLVNVKK